MEISQEGLAVRHSGFVRLQCAHDAEDGILTIAESGRNIFPLQRVYYITNLNRVSTRGRHAHRQLEQIIFCIHGSFHLELDDGQNKQRLLMKRSSPGVRLGPMLWHVMERFSPDCVILVLASDFFDEADYIRSYDEFKRLAAAAP